MGYLYNADQVVGMALNVSIPKPLDVRTVVESIDNLYSIPNKSAYKGMTVANTEDGNIYMLIDTDNITNKSGWKTSGGINTIVCTYDEYQKLVDNTNPDYTAVNPKLDCLNKDTYYYIVEDDKIKGRYLTQEWGDQIYNTLNSKVDNTAILKVREELNTLDIKLNNNYLSSSEIESTYAKILETYNKTELDSKLSNLNDITKGLDTSINEIRTELQNYVTQDQLGGGGSFNFVTESEYNTFKSSIADNFESKTVTTSNLVIQQSEEQSSGLSMGEEGLLLDGKKIALSDEVPTILCVTEEYYKGLEKKEEDTYYFTFSESFGNGYVDNDTLTQQYYTKSQVDILIKNKLVEFQQTVVDPLIEKIKVLESYHEPEAFVLDESSLDEMQIG